MIPEVPTGQSPNRMVIPADLDRVAEVREWVAETGRSFGFSEERVFDLKVATSEAVANGVEHAASSVEIQLWTLPDRLILEVTSDGLFQPARYRDRENRQRGLGLPLMATLADQVHITGAPDGRTTVSLTFYVGQLPAVTTRVEQTRERLGGFWRRLGSTPAVVALSLLVTGYLVAIWVLYALGFETARESVTLVTTFNTLFGAAVSMLLAGMAARSYLISRSRAVLLLGTGWILLALAYMLSGLLISDVNAAVTVHNMGVFAASGCFLACAITAGTIRSRMGRSPIAARVITLAYGGSVLYVCTVILLTKLGVFPSFYGPDGFTAMRQVILGLSALELLAAGGIFAFKAYKSRYLALYWYAGGLTFLALAWVALIAAGHPATPLGWLGRAGMYVSGLFILAGISSLMHEQGPAALSLDRSLTEAEDRYQTLVELSPDAVLVDVDGQCVFCNVACLRMLHAESSDHVVGQPTVGLVEPERQEEFAQQLSRALGGSMVSAHSLGLLRTDGQRFAADFSATSTRFGGRRAVQLVFRDVTHQAEAAATEREQRRLFEVLDTLPAMISLVGSDHQMAFVNKSFRDRFGEVDGRKCFEYRFGLKEPCSDCERLSVLDTGEPHVWETKGPDGSVISAHELPFTDIDGTQLVLEMGLDVTAQRKAERKAVSAALHARGLIEAALDPLVAVGLDGMITDVNEATVQVIGLSRERLIGTDLCDYFTDPERARQGYRRVFAKGSVKDYPLTVRRSDGKPVDVLYNADVYRDESGEIAGVLVAARDMTAYEELIQQREIAMTLQQALSDIPVQPRGVRLGHQYRSATVSAQVGGDFYDVFEAKDGKIVMLMGDVSGHGVEAARVATLVKDVVRAFSLHAEGPNGILRRTNELLVERSSPGFVTLFLGILDTATGTLHYASAGHPEMLLRRTNGDVEVLNLGYVPLGVYPDAEWTTMTAGLTQGDLMLLYTDGVLEVRRDGEYFGQERLIKMLKRKRVTAQHLPSQILDQVLVFSGGSLDDDVALLALSLDGDAIAR